MNKQNFYAMINGGFLHNEIEKCIKQIGRELMKSINIICSDVGTREEKNQDGACIKRAKTSIGMITMAIVCDGVNGMAQGEMASTAIIEEFGAWFERELPVLLEEHIVDKGERLWKEIIKAVKDAWKQKLQEVHQSIYQYGDSRKVSIGSTFTGVMLFDEFCCMIMHVGDSRVYKITDTLECITVDQTLAEREIERGNVTREEAYEKGMQNVLLQCVGGSRNVQPDMIIDYFDSEAIYLLCTDGFWRNVKERDLQKISIYRENGQEGLEDYLKDIVEQLKIDGEDDNITVLAVTNEER